MDVLKRIRPTKLKQVVGNRIQINRFLEVLKNEAFPHRIVLLLGPDGCGKSLITQLACEELGVHTLNIQNEYHSSKELPHLMSTFITNKTVSCFFNQKRKVIVFDNVDILLNTERNIAGMIEDVNELLEKHRVFMIISCRSNEERKLTDALKGKIEVIKINYPSIKDTFVYLSGCELDVEDDRLLQLTTSYKGSIRDIVMNLHFKDNELIDNISFKDMNTFEITKKLYQKPHTMSEIMTLMRDDAMVVAYLLYENFPEEIYHNYDVKKQIFSLCDQMSRNFMTASFMEEYMYTNSDWSLYDLVHLLRIHGTNIMLSTVPRKATRKDIKYRFSQMLSKVSHKNILNKKMKNVLSLNNNIDVMECIVLADVISRDKNVITSGNSKKKVYDTDECNLINTYQKYFE